MRSLSLDQLKAFIEVAERGSFTAAARALNLSQPDVTHQVHELLERLGKRAYPTEAGEKLMEHARHLLDEDAHTRDAMRRFTDGWLGRVRIGTSMTVLMYVLPPLLRRLKTDHPQLVPCRLQIRRSKRSRSSPTSLSRSCRLDWRVSQRQ